MSIATRKAGAVIRCTKCAGEIIVPVPEGHPLPEAADQPSAGQAFESANFDVELEGGASVPATADPPPTPAAIPEPPRAGVFLSIAMLCVSIGVVILLLILMFVAGFVIGRLTAVPNNDHGISKGAPLNQG